MNIFQNFHSPSGGTTQNAAALIEPGVKSFLKLSLQNCRQMKERYYNTIFNVCTLVGFIAIVGTILFIKYKTKPTADEVEQRKQFQREYVLSQLKLVNAKNYLAAKNASYYAVGSGDPLSQSQTQSRNQNQSQMITGLPEWNVGAATAGHYQMFLEEQNEKRNDEEYYMRLKM
jgi:hypothetical protein